MNEVRAIQTGNTYDIYDDSLKTFDQLPARTYTVRCNPRTGFFLEGSPNLEIREEKVYGNYDTKIDKVLRAFKAFDRNLGVILSGKKGIGKSLFARALGKSACLRGYPVIIVDRYYQGIAAYLESIEQEVLVLFDEFDKTFGEIKTEDGKAAPQTEMLSLFDGISQGKKLFVITCNDLRSLNDYLVNRPGRFHYHFRFECPSGDEITEYLQDKVDKVYWDQIPQVVQFATRVDLNYDCLRSIAYELNTGAPFNEAIKDLNIVNLNQQTYKLQLRYKSGQVFRTTSRFDMYDPDDSFSGWVSGDGGSIYCQFSIADCHWDKELGYEVVESKDLILTYDEDDFHTKAAYEATKTDTVDMMILTRTRERDIHYAL